MTPQLVDLNADGHQDMVVATFEGTAFLIEGSEDGWKKPQHIVDENDTNVRISAYHDAKYIFSAPRKFVWAVHVHFHDRSGWFDLACS